jgi:PBSX family phage terminase large subunit
MKIQATNVFERNYNALSSGNYKYIINSGSSRSSKTFSIIQIFWILAWTKERTKLAVFRNTKKDCKDTILQDMLKYYPTLDNWDSIKYNKTESTLTFPNGSTIYIEGTDDELKVHGYHSDYLWFNEIYKVPLEVFNQLDMRCSGVVFLDYNPIGKMWSDDLIKQDNAIVLHSTFKDNPFCPPEQKKKILSYEPTYYYIQYNSVL